MPRVSVKDQGLAHPRVRPAWDFALCCVWTFGRLIGFARDIGPSRQPALLTGGVTSEEVHGIFASRFSLSIPLGTCSVAPHLSECHLRARTEEDAAGPQVVGDSGGGSTQRPGCPVELASHPAPLTRTLFTSSAVTFTDRFHVSALYLRLRRRPLYRYLLCFPEFQNRFF